jgi:hypothetical protein
MKFLAIRDMVRRNQIKQADRMLRRSKRYLPEVIPGNCVTLPIPDVDRGLTDPLNIICRVVDVDWEYSLYELSTPVGVLKELYARNSFDLAYDSLDIEVKLDVTVGLREAFKMMSLGGAQGMLKCNCGSTCHNNKCSCKKANVLCNSRCHAGNSKCLNK